MKSRWFRLSWSVITMICLGLVYAWSVFVTPLEGEFCWNRSDASMTFTICMSAFTIGCIFTGFLVKRIPARVIMMTGAACILLGMIFTSRISTLTGLYLCYGVLCGFGVGIEYNSLLNTILKWFPDRVGMISGILLMGFGFGGSLLGTAAVKLMNIAGWRTTFIILGIVLTVVIIISGVVLRPIRKEEYALLCKQGLDNRQNGKQYTLREMTGTSSFYAVFVWVAVASAIGMAVLSNASPMALSMTENIMLATTASGMVSIFNGLGRFTFGFILDAFHSKISMRMIASGMAVACVVMSFAFVRSDMVLLMVGFVFLGFFFGGITPFLSTYVAKVFGQENYATNFSLLNVCLMGGAFLGPFVAGKAGTVGRYEIATLLFLVFCLFCFVFVSFIRLHFEGKNKIIKGEEKI